MGYLSYNCLSIAPKYSNNSKTYDKRYKKLEKFINELKDIDFENYEKMYFIKEKEKHDDLLGFAFYGISDIIITDFVGTFVINFTTAQGYPLGILLMLYKLGFCFNLHCFGEEYEDMDRKYYSSEDIETIIKDYNENNLFLSSLYKHPYYEKTIHDIKNDDNDEQNNLEKLVNYLLKALNYSLKYLINKH